MDIHKLCINEFKVDVRCVTLFRGAELSTNTDADQFWYFFFNIIGHEK